MSPRSSLMLMIVALLLLAAATVRATTSSGSENVYLPTVLKPFPPTPTPTPVPTPAPETCDILEDDFSDPASGWYVGDNGSATYSYDAGEYRMYLRERTSLASPAPGNWATQAYSVAVDMRWEEAAGSYLALTLITPVYQSPVYHYNIEIQPQTRKYGVITGGGSSIIPYTYAPEINTGSNRVEIVRNGTQVDLFINETYMNSFSIGAADNYRVLLWTGAWNAVPVAARFDNFCGSSLSSLN